MQLVTFHRTCFPVQAYQDFDSRGRVQEGTQSDNGPETCKSPQIRDFF